MNQVISAFIDNEPFDPIELRDALATPEGREELLDLIALRDVVQPAPVIAFVAAPPVRSRARWALAAAAAAMLVVGGYSVGRFVATEQTLATAQVTAPEPTSVFTFEPGRNWNDSLPAGGN
jgi:hypothetical protein